MEIARQLRLRDLGRPDRDRLHRHDVSAQQEEGREGDSRRAEAGQGQVRRDVDLEAGADGDRPTATPRREARCLVRHLPDLRWPRPDQERRGRGARRPARVAVPHRPGRDRRTPAPLAPGGRGLDPEQQARAVGANGTAPRRPDLPPCRPEGPAPREQDGDDAPGPVRVTCRRRVGIGALRGSTGANSCAGARAVPAGRSEAGRDCRNSRRQEGARDSPPFAPPTQVDPSKDDREGSDLRGGRLEAGRDRSQGNAAER